MKSIAKSVEPLFFTQWKNCHPGAGYDDLSRATNSRRVKKRLKNSLIKEQKYLCCYCECRISLTTSHIEHFKPKDPNQFPQLQLDYVNLHASCIRESTGVPEEHCGHKKGNCYSSDLISPLEIDCASHFGYLLDGSIVGLDQRGLVTITVLNLNSSLLKESRKKLIDYFLDLNSEEDYEKCITDHLNEHRSKLEEFYSMIGYFRNTGQL